MIQPILPLLPIMILCIFLSGIVCVTVLLKNRVQPVMDEQDLVKVLIVFMAFLKMICVAIAGIQI